MIDKRVNYTPLSPLSFLERSAYVFREKTAVIHGDQRYTYPQFYERVRRLASALKAAGIEKEDRVAFLAPNIPPTLEAHYGAPLAGGVLVAINTRLHSDEILYILNHSGSKILFVDTELSPLIEPIADKLNTVRRFVNIRDSDADSGLDGPEYEEFLAAGSDDPLSIPVEDENETISINYTSGTTGFPKGVMYTHRSTYLNAISEAMELNMNSSSIYLWTLPMFHCNGWCYTWAVTAVGGTHVCLRKVDPEVIFSLIREEKVSHFCGAPTVLITLSSHPAAEGFKLEHDLRIGTAGAPPSPTIIQQMESMGAEITHLYGLTETYGPHTICEWQPQWDQLPPEERARLKARQGVSFITAVELRVVDGNMNDVPPDGETIGEVVMRGNNVMKGYFKQPDATAEAFQGGWFHSGDLGVMDPDGYISLRDRKKDIIISGGENISTIEVENAIYKHPDVLEVAIIAIPHEKWGEVPKAFITPKPGANLSEEDIISFCRQHLPGFKCPKAVSFGELPKTSTGKIKKFELREEEWKEKEKRIH
jgi:fatty-acyl-CoA synthase